jgi:hypothetical protein
MRSGGLTIAFGVLLLIAPLAFGQLIVRVFGAYTIVMWYWHRFETRGAL